MTDSSPLTGRRRAISRRALLGTGAAAGFLAAGGIAASADPRPGGTLRLALSGGGPDPVWDSLHLRGTHDLVALVGCVYDCLTELRADGSLAGELAERWEMRGDATTWRVSLRAGVRFHDGRAFGAEDAIASLRRHTGPEGVLSDVTNIRRVGARGLEITLASPDQGLPFRLADPRLAIYPAGRPPVDGTPIGTGLFAHAGRTPEGALRFERVGAHYKDGQAGWFTAIELAPVATAAARLAALRSGAADAVDALAPGALPEAVAQRGDLHLALEVSGPGHGVLRQVLRDGIDRPRLVSAALSGAGSIGADHPLAPEGRGLAGLAAPAHAPDTARGRARQAGLTEVAVAFKGAFDGLPVRALLADIGAQLRDLGLTPVAAATAGPDLPRLTIRRGGGALTQGDALARTAASFDDPVPLTALLARARATRDTGTRRALHAEAARLVAEESRLIIPVFADHVFAHSSALHRPPTIGRDAPLDSGRMPERWFFV